MDDKYSLMEGIEFSKISDEEVENRIKKLLLLQKENEDRSLSTG